MASNAENASISWRQHDGPLWGSVHIAPIYDQPIRTSIFWSDWNVTRTKKNQSESLLILRINFASEVKKTSAVGSVHTSYLKHTLNARANMWVTWASTESWGVPLFYYTMAWSLATKYWLRLSEETGNALLNKSYHVAWSENQPWIQSVHHLLSSNGYRNVQINPPNSTGQFHKRFRLRLND